MRLFVQAAHVQMLQLGDKGALLFADKYLLFHSKQCYVHWGEIIIAVVLQDMVNREADVLKQALHSPTSRLKLQYEQLLITGSKQIRLDLESPATSTTKRPSVSLNININADKISDMATNLVWGGPLQPTSAPSNPTAENSALRKLRGHISKVQQVLQCKSRQTLVGYEIPKRPEKLAGDIFVTWLLLRGIALQHMGRVWEALLMFKLVMSLKACAPRTQWVGFVALYHIAEIILNYDVCEHSKPHMVSA
jgi:hypothetical protein